MFSNETEGDLRLSVKESLLVQPEYRQSVLGSRHAFLVDYDSGIVFKDINNGLEMHCLIPQIETTLFPSLFTPGPQQSWMDRVAWKLVWDCLAQQESINNCKPKDEWD